MGTVGLFSRRWEWFSDDLRSVFIFKTRVALSRSHKVEAFKVQSRSVFSMSRSVAFLVVAMLLCIILPSQASDVLQCTGGRLNDGQFFFNVSYEVKEDVHDCETQWLVDRKVVGFSEADGNVEFMTPIVDATVSTVLLQTCPEKFQCLLICPSGNINETKQCSCDTTKTSLTTPFTPRSEGLFVIPVGFRDWRIRVGIGAFVVLLVLASGIVLYIKRRRSR